MNRERLAQFAQHLLDAPPPTDVFTMGYFARGSGGAPLPPSEVPAARGLTGCACLYAFLFFSDKVTGIDTGSWRSFTMRLFDLYSSEFLYLFAGNWEEVDNTSEGVARRILYLLEHGLPDDWKGQMSGDAPLTYQRKE